MERERASVARLMQSVPPHDLDAERCVLASVMLDANAFDDIHPHIPLPDRFYADAHRKMYAGILCLSQAGKPADPVTLADELQGHGALEDVGGPAYLLQVMEAVPHTGHAEYYARIVKEKWRQRSLIDACTDGLREAFSPTDDVQAVCASVESRIRDLSEETAGDPTPFSEALDTFIDDLWKTDCRLVVPTGYRDADNLLGGGLRGGQLIVLAARPGVGKSALASNIAVNVGLSGQSALLFIFEQTRGELLERMLAAHARVDHGRILSRKMDGQEAFALEESASKLRDAGLFFDEVKRRTVAEIAAVCRRQKRKRGLHLVIIDYIQLIQPADASALREQQVAGISRDLKLLSMELDVPILCLAQLNRQVESRDKKKPRLSDLRESGAIEQDADVVAFIDRPITYDESAHPADAEWVFAKVRSGQPGDVSLVWRGQNLLFLPKAPYEPGEF